MRKVKKVLLSILLLSSPVKAKKLNSLKLGKKERIRNYIENNDFIKEALDTNEDDIISFVEIKIKSLKSIKQAKDLLANKEFINELIERVQLSKDQLIDEVDDGIEYIEVDDFDYNACFECVAYRDYKRFARKKA